MDNSVRDQMLGCEKKSLMSQPSDVCLLVYSECEPACLSCLQDLIWLLWPLHVGGAAVVFPLCIAGSHLGADRPLAAHGRCVSMPLLCLCVGRECKHVLWFTSYLMLWWYFSLNHVFISCSSCHGSLCGHDRICATA